MRVIVVGLGIQGNKRAKFAGLDLFATVDPAKPGVNYKSVKDVPLEKYDAALLCIPDEVKIELITYLLENKKHVLVEKPILSKEVTEIQNLKHLAEKNKTVCYTAYNHRFEPHIVRMKEFIESGKLGKIYSTRLFYGNGTARDVRNSEWRDKGAGVLPDLGSHLLDMILFLYPNFQNRIFKPVAYHSFENTSYDHVIFHSDADTYVSCEATLLSWRNSFHCDVYAELGSAHITSLCKWGPTVFNTRMRKFPSGMPTQESFPLEQSDPTWEIEYNYFKRLCAKGGHNLDNDIWISQTLHGLSEKL